MEHENTNFDRSQQAWDQIQEAAMSVARLRRDERYSSLGSVAFGQWVELQAKDLEEGRREIMALQGRSEPSRYRKALEVVENLTGRVGQIRQTHSLSMSILEGIQSIIGSLTLANKIKAEADDADGIIRASSDIQAEMARLQEKADLLSPLLDPTKIENTLTSFREGARPVRQAIEARIASLKSVNKPSDIGVREAPAPQAKPPQATTGTVQKDPEFQKKLGRKLSPLEVEQTSFQFFSMLWEKGFPQGRVGEIMWFIPSKCSGMSVCDLLGYQDGAEILNESLEEMILIAPGIVRSHR